MNPHDIDHGQDDIFPPPIEPAAVAPTSKEPSGGSKTNSGKPRGIKPAYIGGAIVLVVLAWTFGGPMLSSRPKTAPTASALDSQGELPTYKRRHTVVTDAVDDAEFERTGAGAAGPASSQPALVPADQIADLSAQVVDLRAQLMLAQAKNTAPPVPCVPATPAAGPLPQAKRTNVARNRHPSAEPRAVRAAEPPPLPGYHLNTIYRGQAWIEHSQKTYVVEPGQEIDGLHVLRVDSKARSVTTSQGEIR